MYVYTQTNNKYKVKNINYANRGLQVCVLGYRNIFLFSSLYLSNWNIWIEIFSLRRHLGSISWETVCECYSEVHLVHLVQ